jgi:hypothetical protein
LKSTRRRRPDFREYEDIDATYIMAGADIGALHLSVACAWNLDAETDRTPFAVTRV